MIHLTQTKLSGFPEGRLGNCYPTVLACLLHIPIEDIPSFECLYWTDEQRKKICDYYRGKHEEETAERMIGIALNQWHMVMEAWLAGQGYKIQPIEDIHKWLMLPDSYDKYYLASGLSPRDIQHIVIMKNGGSVWDPHPSRGFLKTITRYEELVAI